MVILQGTLVGHLRSALMKDPKIIVEAKKILCYMYWNKMEFISHDRVKMTDYYVKMTDQTMLKPNFVKVTD